LNGARIIAHAYIIGTAIGGAAGTSQRDGAAATGSNDSPIIGYAFIGCGIAAADAAKAIKRNRAAAGILYRAVIIINPRIPPRSAAAGAMQGDIAAAGIERRVAGIPIYINATIRIIRQRICPAAQRDVAAIAKDRRAILYDDAASMIGIRIGIEDSVQFTVGR